MAPTVLVIEDEARIAHWVRAYFEEAGFRAVLASDGVVGLQLARTERPDLIILDLNLPGLDGVSICRTVRQQSAVPIIMLTARGKELDRILGLELGADDYVVKPFSPGELVARARAVLRRTQGEQWQSEVLRSGSICLDITAHTCTVDQQPVSLSRIQFAILAALMRYPGRPLSRQQLLDAAFDENYDGFERVIDIHIRRLRSQIERDPARPQHIVTVVGVGYKFEE
jgi:DNA-binding response OmpR family regulator